MISLEEIRKVVLAEFKALHNALYPTTPVNYPNYTTVDAEHLNSQFVSVELRLADSLELNGVGDEEGIVKGTLSVAFLYPVGVGSQGSAAYLDAIKNYFAFKKINGVCYTRVIISSVSPHPGITGVRMSITFLV